MRVIFFLFLTSKICCDSICFNGEMLKTVPNLSLLVLFTWSCWIWFIRNLAQTRSWLNNSYCAHVYSSVLSIIIALFLYVYSQWVAAHSTCNCKGYLTKVVEKYSQYLFPLHVHNIAASHVRFNFCIFTVMFWTFDFKCYCLQRNISRWR